MLLQVFGDVFATFGNDDVKLTKSIGRGAFGVVFAGQLKKQVPNKYSCVLVQVLLCTCTSTPVHLYKYSCALVQVLLSSRKV